MRFLRKLAASIVLIAQLASAGNAIAQAMPATVFDPTPQPGSGWSYDPATQGMRDLREMKPIEGCNAPGGLTRITDRDAGDSAPFWCGPPPHCLAEGTNGVDACKFIPNCRYEPRYDPNGIPGANGCRDPEDLLCVSSGAHPEGGLCLKTCWDGSRILFSQACPPQCSTDSLGNTVCVTDTPPTAPPQTPTTPTPATPTPTPTPTPKLSCPSGSTPYESCNFSWGTVAHDGATSVASDNGVSGTLVATCDNGSWVNIVASCTPAAPTPTTCPNGKVVPAGQVCPIVPTPTQICPDGITEMPVSGVCPIVPPPTKTCPDSSVVPLTQPCPTTPPPTQTCSDGSVILATDACPTPTPAMQTCPDGSVIPASAACATPQPPTTQTCSDGAVIPANAVCTTPPVADCYGYMLACQSSITDANLQAYAVSKGKSCGFVVGTGLSHDPGGCRPTTVWVPSLNGEWLDQVVQDVCFEPAWISDGACMGSN